MKEPLKNRLGRYVSDFIFSTVGYWLNRENSRYMLSFRPDFHVVYNRLADYKTLFNLWLDRNRSRNCGDLARFYTLHLNVAQVLSDRIPGDFVELGVWRGNSAAVLAHFARSQSRHLYLFDTFGGFDERDFVGTDAEKPHIARMFADTSIAGVQRLVGMQNVTYVNGFFPESAKDVQLPVVIAVAHLDCDLYEPTKAALALFYERLAPGGMILVHDYSSGCWPGVTNAVDEFFEHLPEKPVLAADKSGTAIIRRQSTPVNQ